MQGELAGPWYNFQEVEKKTGLVQNEILYHIETGTIPAVVHSTNRPFLAVSLKKTGKVTGHAMFRYGGPISVPRNIIKEIIRDEQALTKAEPVKPLQLLNVDEWETAKPFNGHCPNGVIDDWQPLSFDELEQRSWTALVFPQEVKRFDYAESSLVDRMPHYYDEDEFFERFARKIIIRSPSSPYFYATHVNSDFYLNDLRLPRCALDKLLGNTKSKPDNVRKAGSHDHELYNIFLRAIEDNPGARSNILWKKIRMDVEQEHYRYDRDELIDRMDNHCIEWTSTSGTSRVHRYTSFKTKISNLRKSLRGSGSEKH